MEEDTRLWPNQEGLAKYMNKQDNLAVLNKQMSSAGRQGSYIANERIRKVHFRLFVRQQV